MKTLNVLPIILIRLYQICLSPALPKSCRFYPTCSSYALEAFRRYNIFQAFFLSVKRILKCHPFHEGGYDPPPTSKE